MIAQGHNPRIHRACGGGVYFTGYASDGKPHFECSKCGHTWTDGIDGGIWKVLVTSNKPPSSF